MWESTCSSPYPTPHPSYPSTWAAPVCYRAPQGHRSCSNCIFNILTLINSIRPEEINLIFDGLLECCLAAKSNQVKDLAETFCKKWLNTGTGKRAACNLQTIPGMFAEQAEDLQGGQSRNWLGIIMGCKEGVSLLVHSVYHLWTVRYTEIYSLSLTLS